MNRQLSPVQEPELIGRRRPVDQEPPEALDPAAAFAMGQWATAKHLAQPGRPPRRRWNVQAGLDLLLSINGAKMQERAWGSLRFRTAARQPAPPACVDGIERRVGARLPEDYRKFLSTVNGGRPVGPEGSGDYAMVDIDWKGRAPQESDERAILDVLLAAEDWSENFTRGKNPALTLDGVYTDFVATERRLPPGMVAIGRDPGSSLFVLDVAGRPGEVWFWAADWFDRSRLVSDPYHNMARLAPSFSSLLDMLVFED